MSTNPKDQQDQNGQNPHPAVRFDKVSVDFSGFRAVDGVSFDVHQGETRIILGAAGSGKTLLLKLALGLIRPTSGRIYLFGQDITDLKEQELFDIRGRCGILFQEGGLFDSLNIEENVGYPLVNQKLLRCPAEEVHQRVEEALRLVGLEHTLDKFPSELSGGMRRRVGIARANVTEPPLVLYDSPTAGLDPITANNIMSLIVKERDLKQTTTIMVTHRFQDGEIMANYRYNPETQELEAAGKHGTKTIAGTQYMVMKEARLVFEGHQGELEASKDPYVAKFVMRH
jgi:phospholipid/cholesterol/gamma-HCH transport system ATP-binding protein